MKPYCTQNNGDCSTCSLVNYNRDCQNNPVKEELKTTSIMLTTEQYNRLRRESFDTQKSQSEIIREALELRWAQKEKEENKMSRFNWEGYGFDERKGAEFEKKAFAQLPHDEAKQFIETIMESNDVRVIDDFEECLSWWRSL